MKGHGNIFKHPLSPYWHCHYSLRGKLFRQSTGVLVGEDETKSKPKAERFLKQKLREVGADLIGAKTFIPPKAQKITMGELLDSLEADYKLRGKYSASVKTNIKHLREKFGFWLAMDFTSDNARAYIEQLRTEKYSIASINRHTQVLGQAFTMAVRERRLNHKPFIPHLSEVGNARSGFASESQARLVASNLPDYLGDVVLFAFYSAWRRGEVLTLTWGDVHGDTITLRAENSKERETRFLALEGELATVIERRRKVKKGNLIFHSGDGDAIVDFRKSWATACRMAGCPKLLFHDLRRSAVKGMIVAGVAPHVAMSLSGHKTDSMLRRYAIISEADQRAALIRTEEFRQAERAKQLEQQQKQLSTTVQ